MRNDEDKKLRNIEIQIWFFSLQRVYMKEGMSPQKASEKACEEIGVRFCLKKETVNRYKNIHRYPPEERERLIRDARQNLSILKNTIEKIESEIRNE